MEPAVIPPKYAARLDLYIPNSTLGRRLENLNRSGAVALRGRLSMSHPLGIDPESGGARFGSGPDDQSVLDNLFDAKSRFPDSLVLIRVGEFYEAYGIDSIFLVEFAGLNAMGKSGLAKAGLPLGNIHALLESLIAEQFSVVMIEQEAGTTGARKRKRRFIAAVVSEQSPVYAYGLASSSKNVDFPASPPVIAIRESKVGFDVVAVYVDERRVLTYEGLNFDMALSTLASSGSISSVYVSALTSGKMIDQIRLSLHNKSGTAIKLIGRFSAFSSISEFSSATVAQVKYELGLNEAITFEMHRPAQQALLLPSETAEQIGLGTQAGVPSLLQFCLPSEASAIDRDLAKSILLKPYDSFCGDAMRRLVCALETAPPHKAFISARTAKFVKLLSEGEAHAGILSEIKEILTGFLQSFPGPHEATSPLSQNNLSDAVVLAGAVSGLTLNPRTMQLAASDMLEDLDKALCGIITDSALSSPEVDFFRNIDDGASTMISPTGDLEFRQALSSFSLAKDELLEACRLHSGQSFRFDSYNLAVYAKDRWASPDCVPAVDVNGAPLKGFSTLAISLGVTKVLSSRCDLHGAGLKALKLVCATLSLSMQPFIGIVYASSILRLAELLSISRKRRGWGLSTTKADSGFSVENGFPYWMPRGPQTQTNHFSSDGGLRLLFGANMSGKSTYLRMIASVGLLSSVGFPYPATSVTGGPIDAIFIRMGASDDPERRLSAFAIEMLGITSIINRASNKSLVLIDELGKGTSSREGSAIAGAIFESLRLMKTMGVFATHWCELFDLKLSIPGESVFHVETKGRKSTHKVIQGKKMESFAFDTSLAMGCPMDIVQRAHELANPDGPTSELFSDRSMSHSRDHLVKLIKSVVPGPVAICSEDQVPPSALIGTSSVYVLKTKSGLFYVGETDDVVRRLEEHRAHPTKRGAEMFVASMGTLNKSASLDAESRLIQKLALEGFNLLSDHDG